MMYRLIALFGLSLPCLCSAQSVEFTIGVGQPVANVSLPLYVFISNPAHTPIPTGTVTLSFGDGQTETDTLTRGLVITSHTYATPGPVTINAAYNADANFGSVTTSQSRVVLSSAPSPITLSTFGSSTTAGVGASSTATDYASLTAAAQGWTLNNQGISGFYVSNETAQEYALTVTPQTYSSLLIGTNEITIAGATPAGSAEYTNALIADLAWLLVANNTPQKVLAQNSSVVRTGTWTTSDLYSNIGLQSQVAGSSLSFTLPGSTLYAALSARSGDGVYSITVDGQLFGTYQPTVTIGTTEVFGVRIPTSATRLTNNHTVTIACVTPGANGCRVDFVSSNGATAPLAPPYLWLMSPENTAQGYPAAWYDTEAADVKGLTNLFASDGFTVAYGDLDYRYSGLASPECFAADHLHSVDCGHQLIAATLVAAMNNVNSALQRISFTSLPTASTTGSVNLQASATSGLPVTFTVDSGPATLNGTTLTASAAGSVVITAHQAGSASFLAAPNASQTVTFPGADPGLALTISNHVYGDASFALAATTKSSGAVTYSVVSGPATISAKTLTLSGVGTVTVQVAQAASGIYAASSVTTSFAVAPATPVLRWTPAASSILGGTALGTTILNATSATAGTFAYTATASGSSPVAVSATTILASGTYTLSAVFTPAASANYASAIVTAPLTVLPQHVWVSNSNGSVSVLDDAGRSTSSATSVGGQGVAIDNAGNAWSINKNGNSVVKLNASGANAVSTLSGGGLSGATALAFDGNGQLWVTNNNGTVTILSGTGSPITNTSGMVAGAISSPTGIAIDISGNVWISNSASNSVTEILGGAAPVMPLANAAASNAVAQKP